MFKGQYNNMKKEDALFISESTVDNITEYHCIFSAKTDSHISDLKENFSKSPNLPDSWSKA